MRGVTLLAFFKTNAFPCTCYYELDQAVLNFKTYLFSAAWNYNEFIHANRIQIKKSDAVLFTKE